MLNFLLKTKYHIIVQKHFKFNQFKYFSMDNSNLKLFKLRDIMKRKGYDSYIVPHTDAHKVRKFLI